MSSSHQPLDLSLGLEDTHVLVTGGKGLIGRVVVDAFIAAGARVSSLDIMYTGTTEVSSQLFQIDADVSSEESMNRAWLVAVNLFGPVECCVALASLDLSVLRHHDSLADMSWEQFKETLEVNVGGTFLAARFWLSGLKDLRFSWSGRTTDASQQTHRDLAEYYSEVSPTRLKNLGLIIVGSESGWFGERSNADYAASKSAVQVGLLQSLKADVPRVWDGARVNAIAPGPVDTARFKEECRQDPNQFYLDAQATASAPTSADETVADSITLDRTWQTRSN